MKAKFRQGSFAHPGDPIAYPLATLLPSLVDGEFRYLDIKDVMLRPADLPDFLLGPFSQTALALIHGRAAHGSYWHSQQVARKLVQTIQVFSNRERRHRNCGRRINGISVSGTGTQGFEPR